MALLAVDLNQVVLGAARPQVQCVDVLRHDVDRLREVLHDVRQRRVPCVWFRLQPQPFLSWIRDVFLVGTTAPTGTGIR